MVASAKLGEITVVVVCRPVSIKRAVRSGLTVAVRCIQILKYSNICSEVCTAKGHTIPS